MVCNNGGILNIEHINFNDGSKKNMEKVIIYYITNL